MVQWEGLNFDELNEKYHDDYQNWIQDPLNYPPTEGENFKSLVERANNEINNIVNENPDGSNVAIVTHGGIIVGLLANWLKIPG